MTPPCRPEYRPHVQGGFTKTLQCVCFHRGVLISGVISCFISLTQHLSYISDCRLQQRMSQSSTTTPVYWSCLVTGSVGMSVSTRSSVSTTCSDSGDDDSAGITTTGLMCSDRADARRKLGGCCKKYKAQF